MFLGNNIASFAFRNWGIHNKGMNKALERLSSGYRINSAADDPAGFAISEKMKCQLALLKSEKYTTSNHISALDVQDAAMGEVQSMLNRMLELADLSMNGAYTDSERQNMNKEYQQMLDEINRVGAGTTFNSMSLFGKTSESQALTSEEGKGGAAIHISIGSGDLNGLLDQVDDLLLQISTAAGKGDQNALLSLGIDRSNGRTDAENLQTAVNSLIQTQLQSLSDSLEDKNSNEAQYTLTMKDGNISIRFPSVDDQSLGLKDSDILTAESASKAMESVKSAINRMSSLRGDNGAMRNRLERTMESLERMSVNLTDSLSRIMDADMAQEMLNFTKEKMLSQVAMFVMAHANQEAGQVVTLIHTM